MQIAKKIRLYLNKEQEELFWQFAGTSRWAWNESLAYRIARYGKDGSNTTIQQGIEHIQDLKHNNPDYSNMCEKPTPLGVGWIAQNIKIICM